MVLTVQRQLVFDILLCILQVPGCKQRDKQL
jgi:hypothetical protein